jgi:uncharacterized membrane protein
MGKIISGTFLALVLIMAVRCTYKKAEDVYPVNNTGTCDTSNVSYAKTIQPVLSTNCYSCHSKANSALGGGYVLDNYNDLAVQAQKGFLYANVAEKDLNSPSHMPRGAPSLADCEIFKIKAWVDQGYKNN